MATNPVTISTKSPATASGSGTECATMLSPNIEGVVVLALITFLPPSMLTEEE